MKQNTITFCNHLNRKNHFSWLKKTTISSWIQKNQLPSSIIPRTVWFLTDSFKVHTVKMAGPYSLYKFQNCFINICLKYTYYVSFSALYFSNSQLCTYKFNTPFTGCHFCAAAYAVCHKLYDYNYYFIAVLCNTNIPRRFLRTNLSLVWFYLIVR